MEIEKGKKLLLVEDEALTSMITSKMLKKNGYDVVTVNSGTKAVERALTDTSIDLILMDIDLGADINGPEAARRILQIQNIPIVFLTSHSERDVVDMVKEITRYGYVIKNSGDFVLLSSIEMAFELFESHKSLKASADYLRVSEEKVRAKLDTILSPEGDIGELELADIVDVTMLQSIMEDFNDITNIGMAIVDLKGKVLVATGWQDICTEFHRVNPDSCRNCVESDTVLSRGIAAGTYKLYRCKNNMWDMATPIEVGGKHVGNLFMGQFLFEEDVLDYDLFRSQALQYGFDEKKYIEALNNVPRWGRDTIFTAMTFFIKLSNIISKLSYSNIKLARTLSERDRYSDLHRMSEARLGEVTDNMVDLVARLDADWCFQYVSPSYEKILGYRPDELIGTWPPEIFHPSGKDKNIKDIFDICSAGEGSAEFRMRHKNGTYRWFEATGRNLYDEKGIFTGAVLGGRDITEKKIAETKLSKKNKQYKDLFDSMIDGFALHEIIVDEWGRAVDYIFLEVNPAFERYTGLHAEDIIGRRVTELMPDIEPYWIETYGQVAFTGVQITIENFSSTLNKWFKVTSYSPERGYFAAIFEEITDRKKGEELLREKDERYRRLFESVVGYVYTVYIENRTPVKTVHGPGCEAITGYTPDNFDADPELWYKMIHPDDRGRVILFASDIINKGIFSPIEHRIICRDGTMSWVRNTPVPNYDSENKLAGYDSIIADISERKITEISLKESEALFSKAFYQGPLMMVISDFETGRYIEANDNFCKVTGYSRDEVIDKVSVDLGLISREERAALLEDFLKAGNINGKEIKARKKNGETFRCLYYGEMITVHGRKELLSIIEDISDQKKIESKLRNNEEMMWNIINSSTDYISVKDTDLKLILCNDIYAAALDKKPSELIGKNDIENGRGEEFVRGNAEKGFRGYEQDDLLVLSGEKVSIDSEPGYVNGRLHYFNTVKIPIYKNKKITSILGISRDITERAAADREKKAISDLLRIFNISNDMHDMMKTVLVFLKNLSGCEAAGIRLHDGEDYPYFETDGFSDEFIKMENSLCAYDINGQLMRDDTGNPLIECMCGNIISGRFDPSKPFFTDHGSFWSNCTTGLQSSSSGGERQPNTRNRCIGTGYESIALIPLRVADKTFGLIQLNDRRKEIFTEELIKSFERIVDNIAIAVSEKIARKQLEEIEERYRLIVEKNPSSIFLIRDGKYIFANSAAAELLGYKSSDELIGMEFEKNISPANVDDLRERLNRSINGESNPPMEITIVRPDGTLCLTESISFPIHLSDGPAMLVMGQDITEQRSLEKKIISGEFKFNALTESSSAGIYFTDKNGDCVYANRSWLEMSGLTMDEAKGQGWMKALHPEDRETIGAKWYESVQSNGYWGFEYRFLNRNGETVWVKGTASPIHNQEGELTGYVGTNINITDQKKAMIYLSESERRFRNLFEHTPVAYQSLDIEGRIIDVNDNWLQLTGYSRDDVTGKSFGELWTPEARTMFPVLFRKFLKIGIIDDAELSLIKKNGGILTVILTGRVQSGSGGEFEKTHCIIVDISGRKEMEDILRADEDKINLLLKEKELLLREVHHRIKNNMNSISGLLMLQAASMTDNAAVTALNDARSRVQSMMIMYDKLYRSEDYRSMSVKEYLEKFIDEIFMIFENSRQVIIEKDIEDFILDTKILFPLGIIINELITNSFKYAFPGGRKGIIKVSAKKNGDEIIISIRDDGAGVSDEVASSNSGGFGLNLVSALTEQIGGEVKIKKDNGTVVEIHLTPEV